MQLRNARLCLDCEEVHDGEQCPVCASESMAFITRWVPAPERRARPRPVEPHDPEGLETYRQLLDARRQSGWRMVGQGAAGLALFGVAGWLWRRRDTRSGSGQSGSAQSGPTQRGPMLSRPLQGRPTQSGPTPGTPTDGRTAPTRPDGQPPSEPSRTT